MQHTPAALLRRFLARPGGRARRPVHGLENHIEPDRLQAVGGDAGGSIDERNVRGVDDYDRFAVVACFAHELPGSCEIVMLDRLGTDVGGIRTGTGEDRIAGSGSTSTAHEPKRGTSPGPS